MTIPGYEYVVLNPNSNSAPPLCQPPLILTNVDAWLDGDVDRTVDLYTDNTVYMVPGAPMIHGRDAVRRHFAAEFTKRDGVGLEMNEPVQEVVSFGDWAVARGIGASTETRMGKSTSVTCTSSNQFGPVSLFHKRDFLPVDRPARCA